MRLVDLLFFYLRGSWVIKLLLNRRLKLKKVRDVILLFHLLDFVAGHSSEVVFILDSLNSILVPPIFLLTINPDLTPDSSPALVLVDKFLAL